MIKIEKINEKIELLDVEVQGLPNYCKLEFENTGKKGQYNCLYDCNSGGQLSKYASDAY